MGQPTSPLSALIGSGLSLNSGVTQQLVNQINQRQANHQYQNQLSALQQMHQPIHPENQIKAALKPILDGTASESDWDTIMPLFTFEEHWPNVLPPEYDMFDYELYDQWAEWSLDIETEVIFSDMRLAKVNNQLTALDGNMIVRFINIEDRNLWSSIKTILEE